MTGSPTPEEREKADAELKAKEAAEQATLPYKWAQTIKDLDVTIQIDGKYKGRDLDVKFTKSTLKVAIKGQDPIIEVGLPLQIPQVNDKALVLTQTLGRASPRNPRRRVHMDTRDHSCGQGNRHPSRQSEQDGMVGARHNNCSED